MNKDVILGVIRHVLTAGGGILVSSGYIDASNMDIAAGAIVALIGVVWSVIKNKKAA